VWGENFIKIIKEKGKIIKEKGKTTKDKEKKRVGCCCK